MKGEVLVNDLTVRTEMRTGSETDTRANLNIGDIVYGTVLGNWIAYSYVYRKSANMAKETFPGTRYSAIKNPLNLSQIFIRVTEGDDVEPVPVPPVDPLPTFEIVIGGSDYEIVEAAQVDNKIVIQIRPKQ